MISLRFNQLQHPVGQGGFHTGWLSSLASPVSIGPLQGHPLLVWAYDCGSDQLAVLKNELKRVRGVPLNMLFLSHLDDDHVSGVDTLLTTVARVDEVVLPYLSDDGWVLHIAAGASSGSLSGTYLDLASDPAGWFGRRGVRRLIYVDGSDDDGDEDTAPDPVDPVRDEPALPEDPRALPERLKIDWSRPLRPLGDASPDDSKLVDGEQAPVETVLAERGAVATVNAEGATLNWVLAPFSFRPSRMKMAAFKAKLAIEFGPGLTAAGYAAQARSHSGREKLRECYDTVWKTHNLHSMALYAGPAIAALGKVPNTAWHGGFTRRIVMPGWLSTGDFNLTVRKRRTRLIRYYTRYSSLVGQLTLPHHGSDHSFDAAIIGAYPNLASALAAVGANGHGHPGHTVQRTIAATTGCTFVRVDENPSSWYEVAGPVG